MDFIVGLPLTSLKVDSIWETVYRFTKSAHFIPMHTHFIAEKYTKIYIAHILYLHGVPKMIVSDRGSQFVAHFRKQLHASLGTHLVHSLANHPQMDGQTERVNQILEDMLRAYVMENQARWYKNLSWVEFSYNNSYQESVKMAPFEALYQHRCHTPLN
jgi:transposase InsO family protein